MLKEFLSIFSIFYDVKAQIIKVFRCFLIIDKEKKEIFTGVTSTLKIIVFLHNKLALYSISILITVMKGNSYIVLHIIYKSAVT